MEIPIQPPRAERGKQVPEFRVALANIRRRCKLEVVAFCRVSYVDIERVRHEVQVEADTLYEAVVKAVHHFRAGLWHGNPPGSGCEFNVQIWRQHPVSYKIALAKVEQHARHGTAKGPKDILFRQKLRDWLGITDQNG